MPPTEPPAESTFDGPHWVDRWILPFVREPTLWPVLVVVIGHAIALAAPLLLLAVRDGSGGAAASLALLGLASLAIALLELRRRGRLGPLAGLLLTTWLLSAAAAWAADRFGIF